MSGKMNSTMDPKMELDWGHGTYLNVRLGEGILKREKREKEGVASSPQKSYYYVKTSYRYYNASPSKDFCFAGHEPCGVE